VGGGLVFCAVCFAVYKFYFKSETIKKDAFRQRGDDGFEKGFQQGYELATAQPATAVPVYGGELLSIKDVQTSL
jgi:hypothetical protein